MPLPERSELLALMDLNWLEMCRECIRATPGGWVEERERLVCCGSPLGTFTTNMVLVAGLVSASVVRAASDRCFRARELPFSVWTRAHADAELERRLSDEGFIEVHQEPGMVLGPGELRPDAPPAELAIRPVRDDTGRAAYAEVAAEAFAVYGAPRESTRSHFASLASVRGPTTQGFVGWRDGVGVAAATLVLSHGVGGIAWVGVMPDAFHRG
jgi:hypothetical protein